MLHATSPTGSTGSSTPSSTGTSSRRTGAWPS